MFWAKFEHRFGPPGELPESYWSPALGHFCHLRPSDLDTLTPAQLNACGDFVEANSD